MDLNKKILLLQESSRQFKTRSRIIHILKFLELGERKSKEIANHISSSSAHTITILNRMLEWGLVSKRRETEKTGGFVYFWSAKVKIKV